MKSMPPVIAAATPAGRTSLKISRPTVVSMISEGGRPPLPLTGVSVAVTSLLITSPIAVACTSPPTLAAGNAGTAAFGRRSGFS